ncbi:MAG TPA: hypothetical protein DCY74_06335 [Clostridiales bacterium]|nr:hypothetical protein [Clostridiales bacterium]HCG35827.1 hypothetical protein [Clostridiales bacterium]
MIKIITDSTIYVKKAEVQELEIRIVPVTYTVNGYPYCESYADNNGNFKEFFKYNRKLTTSGPNPSAFLSAFEEELALGNEVLCMTISSRLSGTYSAAYMAAKQTESKDVFVVDSHLTAGGLYLLVCEAKKCIDQGETMAEIIQKLLKIRDKITVAFSVDDMTPLRNSGRIGFVRMSVGTFLNIKPILLCKDGAVVSESSAHGNNGIVKKLVEKIPSYVSELTVNYIANNRLACHIYTAIREKYPDIKMRMSQMGPVLAVHLGLDVVGISFLDEKI